MFTNTCLFKNGNKNAFFDVFVAVHLHKNGDVVLSFIVNLMRTFSS